MNFDEEFLEILACPRCGGEVVKKKDSLHCEDCDSYFKIIDGIPNMMP